MRRHHENQDKKHMRRLLHSGSLRHFGGRACMDLFKLNRIGLKDS